MWFVYVEVRDSVHNDVRQLGESRQYFETLSLLRKKPTVIMSKQ